MVNGKIYFDMDGVLADFDRGVAELLGLPVVDQKSKTPEQDDEMFEAMRKLGHFYGKLEPMPGAVDLLKKCWEKYGDRCEILTGIPKEKRGITDAAEDKIKWMKEQFDFDIKVNIVLRADKPKFARGKEDLLIDDFEKNIREWEDAGGTGVLYTNAEEVWQMLKYIEARDKYFECRATQHQKLKNYVKKTEYIILSGVKPHFNEAKKLDKVGYGNKNYDKGGKIKPFDLTSWKFLFVRKGDFDVFINLQSFDYDADSKNYHTLLDRVGIYVSPKDTFDGRKALNEMIDTGIDLPFTEETLKKLFEIIDKAVEDAKN